MVSIGRDATVAVTAEASGEDVRMVSFADQYRAAVHLRPAAARHRRVVWGSSSARTPNGQRRFAARTNAYPPVQIVLVVTFAKPAAYKSERNCAGLSKPT